MSDQCDVIIVGGGTAGSIMVRRLIDAGLAVHLLEAGRSDVNPAIHDLSRLGEIWHSEDDWDYFTTPQVHAFDRRLHWPRGKVLGGSHSLNASIYVRGAMWDYDNWKSQGNPGWGWDDVAPLFTGLENFHGSSSGVRGTSGPLDITTDYPRNPVAESIRAAAVQAGIPDNPDYNSGLQEGVSWEQLTFRDGKRLSTYRAFLKPVEDNPKLTVTTGAWVHRLLVEKGRVVGVEFEKDGSLQTLRAGEVVLAGGTLDSPRVLLLSGIGPAKQLEDLGIDVLLDLPGVGENLHDHLLVPIIYRATEKSVGPPPEWMPVTQVHWFSASRTGLPVPDTQPIAFDVPMVQDGMIDPPSDGFTIMGGLVSPKSRGTFRLSARDPHARTLQNPNILDHPDDVRSLIASVEQVLEVGRQSALVDEWGAEEAYPLEPLEIEEYVRRNAITYHHQVGTCRMGIDDLAVVNPSLAVHGLAGLRIADASVMPTITTGNTNAPTMVIAEQGARFILAGRAS